MGLRSADALAGDAGLRLCCQFLGRMDTIRCLPTVASDGLKGGVKYWDGQFDDARVLRWPWLRVQAALEGALLVIAGGGLRSPMRMAA